MLALTEPAPLAQVLQRLLQEACDVVGAPQGAVGLYDPDRRVLVVQVATHDLRPWLPSEVAPGKGLLGTAWERGEVLAVEDYDAWEGRLETLPAGVVGSGCAVPLRSGGCVLGVLAVGHPSPRRPLRPGQLRLLEDLADLAAVAVESARQREVVQRRARELELLHRLHLVLDAQHTEQGLLEATVRAIHEILGYERVAVFLLEAGELVLRAHTAPPDERPVVRVPLTVGINGRAARTGIPQLVPDVHQDPDFLGSVEGVQSLLALPLRERECVLGTLSVETLKPRTLSREDARFLEEVAHVVSRALVEVRLQEAVRHNERWFRALVERSGEAVVVLGAGGRIRYASPSVRFVLGYAAEEMVGRWAARFVHPAEWVELRAAFVQGLAGGQELQAVVRAHHRDGTWRWVQVLARNLAADPDVAGVVVNFHDITERWQAEQTARVRARQHAALAALGQLALNSDLDTLLQSATELVAQALSVELCKIIQILPEEGVGLLRAGVGWKEGLVGRARVPLEGNSQAGYTLQQAGPVVVEDLRSEIRFRGPALLHEHGVVSGVSVVVPGGGTVWGVLAAHTPRRRHFSEDDVHFLQAAAALLGAAVRRWEDEQALRRRATELGAVAELGRKLRGASSPEEVQRVVVDYAAAVTSSEHAAWILPPAAEETARFVAARGAFAAPSAGSSSNGTDQVGPRAEVPLVAGQRQLGFLVVARQPGAPGYEQAERRVLEAVAELGASALSRAVAFAELERAYIDAVMALARAVDARDAYTADHSERMAQLAEALARQLGCTEDEVQEVRWAALLHDIGKLAVPDAVLRKPGPLSPEEWAVVRRHPVAGEEILSPVHRFATVARLVRHHQERWDGTGYPDGLRGEQIPLGARILAVVDAYTAMTEHRPYRQATSHEAACQELQRYAGTQFDPQVVSSFLKVLETHPFCRSMGLGRRASQPA